MPENTIWRSISAFWCFSLQRLMFNDRMQEECSGCWVLAFQSVSRQLRKSCPHSQVGHSSASFFSLRLSSFRVDNVWRKPWKTTLTPPHTLVLKPTFLLLWLHVASCITPGCWLSLSESNCLQTIKTPDSSSPRAVLTRQEGPCEISCLSATFSARPGGQEDASARQWNGVSQPGRHLVPFSDGPS